MQPDRLPSLRMSWTIWGLGALLYLIGFFHRVAPGVMTNELTADFHLNAVSLGHLSAFYFYSYVAMQIPTGLLADHWGPRRLLALGATVAGFGTFVFAVAPDATWANIGRLLIGGAVAVAFVGMLKLASHWLPPKQYAMASGIALLCGIFGAVLAGVPLGKLVDQHGWRPIMIVTAIATLGVALAIWFAVRDDPAERGYASYAAISGDDHVGIRDNALQGIRSVLRYRNTWLLYLIPGGIVGSVLTFSGLWGIPFLTTHYGMEKTEAATMSSTLLIAWAVGGPVFGWLSDHMGRRKPLYTLGCLVILVGWAVLILVPSLPVSFLTVLLIVVGFFSGNMIIGFAFAKESAPVHLAGTASGIVNMGVMMGPMLLQPAVGWMLDRSWQGEMSGDARVYSLQGYQNGFSLMLAWLVLALILVLFTRETHCRQAA